MSVDDCRGPLTVLSTLIDFALEQGCTYVFNVHGEYFANLPDGTKVMAPTREIDDGEYIQISVGVMRGGDIRMARGYTLNVRTTPVETSYFVTGPGYSIFIFKAHCQAERITLTDTPQAAYASWLMRADSDGD